MMISNVTTVLATVPGEHGSVEENSQAKELVY